ncbi:DUF5667 domain-containing protein [Virgibacillus sp. LDC-1]|uniref:DUF5667 domain-containing protein n=1 Tax=Virgibacillus sp. LDC-1 TaxID=3039856 RepID=UPI0024DED9FA|nr:DUF5667 domain-containing protein [Virgibacillus sp. LDC-1]
MENKLKKILTTTVFAGTLLVANSAYADTTGVEGNNTTKEPATEQAGMTPDHFFYFFDKLGENMQLLFTTDPEKESDLLLQFANERLSEAEQMAGKDKDKYVNKLIDAYLTNLEKAQENVAEIVISEKIDQTVKEDLSTKLEDVTSVSDAVTEKLEEEKAVTLEEKRQEAYLVANVVKDLDPEKVKTLREQGFGFGEIVKVVALAQESGKTEDEIAAMLNEGKGYGEIAKELNVDPGQIMKKVIKKKEKYIDQMLEKAKEAGDETVFQNLLKAKENIKRKKIEFKIVKEYAELEEEIKKELLEIKKDLAAGKITQEEADRKIKELQEEAAEEFNELKEEAEDEAREEDDDLDDDQEDADDEAEELAEKQKEKAEKAREKREEAEERARGKAEKAQEKREEAEEKAREKAEKEREKREEAEERAREKAEKEREKREEAEEKAKEKAEKANKKEADDDDQEDDED